MKPEPELRPGGPADLPEVMRVMESAFDPSFGEAWTASQLGAVLAGAGAWLRIARCGGETCGFAVARAVGDEAELLLIGVSRAWRRQGVGAALLQEVLDDARKRGVHRLFLEMRDGNQAEAMYRAAGFSNVGRRPRYYRGADGQLHDALTFICSVGQ